jgi:hypothetical protein
MVISLLNYIPAQVSLQSLQYACVSNDSKIVCTAIAQGVNVNEADAEVFLAEDIRLNFVNRSVNLSLCCADLVCAFDI